MLNFSYGIITVKKACIIMVLLDEKLMDFFSLISRFKYTIKQKSKIKFYITHKSV